MRRAAMLALALLLLGGCGGMKGVAFRDNRELYERAVDQIQRGKHLRARKTLGLVGLAEPIEPELDPLVKLAQAETYYFQGGNLNVIEAQSRYQQFLNFFPTHGRAAYAQYQLGECLLRQSEAPQNDQNFTRLALDEFRRVATLDPNGPYARAARSRMQWAESKLAEHEWLVARFYSKRKLWPAVIGRLRTLLDTYPGYAQRDKVYLLLGQTLIRTGAETEGRIYLNKLVNDYPDGDAAASAREILSRAPEESGG